MPVAFVTNFVFANFKIIIFAQKAHTHPVLLLVIPRKRWLCPDMTEKLLTGTLSINTNTLCQESVHMKNCISDCVFGLPTIRIALPL